MASVLIYNIGTLISGDINNSVIAADAIYIEDGLFREIGTSRTSADTIINAQNNMVIPGLIDSHVHLSIGDFTPVQNATNWISNYLHGGVTRMVSAGELHLPGLPIDDPNPVVFRSLAIVTRACYDRYRPAGVKVEAGTLLLVPGLTESDFDAVAAAGSKCVKFIFYPYGDRPEEMKSYIAWARQKKLKIKIHAGGVSRSGVSRAADARVILDIEPDIVGHITGGPIPLSLSDMESVVVKTSAFLEIVYNGNHAYTMKLLQRASERNQLNRIILGTDTPSGAGVTPRGMLRIMAIAASADGVKPEEAICMATGGPARAHNLDSGFIQTGKPADLLIVGKIEGSPGDTPLAALKEGNLLGITMALIDGRIAIRSRSRQTPPPEICATIDSEKTENYLANCGNGGALRG